MFVIIVVVCLLFIIVAGIAFNQKRKKITNNSAQNDERLQQIVSHSSENVKDERSLLSKVNFENSSPKSVVSNRSSLSRTSSHSSEIYTNSSSARSSASVSESSSESSEMSVDTGDFTDKHMSSIFKVNLNSEPNADQNERTELTKSKKNLFKEGQTINGRYVVHETIGEGTFGLVVSAVDKSSEQKVAIKVINNQKHKRMAKEEVEVLKKLLEIDPQGTHLFVRMEECFKFGVYCCIVFEILGLSVYEYQKQREYEPYSLSHIRHIAYQICYAINFLHSHKLTHTDLKPENVVFVDYPLPMTTYVKLIDFGSATFEEEGFSGIVTTRHYRAPEVLLQLRWSYPCDVWSIGCVLCEMYNGDVLFPKTHENSAHLWMMQRIIGPIPAEMRLETRKSKYFNDGLEKLSSSQKEKIVNKCNPLRSYMRSEEDRDLFDLISRMLTYEHKYRITCELALQHQFFDELPFHFRLP